MNRRHKKLSISTFLCCEQLKESKKKKKSFQRFFLNIELLFLECVKGSFLFVSYKIHGIVNRVKIIRMIKNNK